MQEKRAVDDELAWILENLNMSENEDKGYSDTNLPEEEEEVETIHLYIYREEPKKSARVVEADATTDNNPPLVAFTVCFIAILIPLLSLAFQIFLIFNPRVATITLIPVEKEISAKADILVVTTNPNSIEIIGFPLRPVSLTQTKIAPATGHGHQNARNATGTITFYNGSFSAESIPQGTQLTGKSGVNVVTDEAATIPPAQASTPPTYGEVTVSAHAVNAGSTGNIPVRDINTACCGVSILAQNTKAFHGGADARDFSIVTVSDIDTALSSLKMQASQSIQAQLLSEVQAGQALIPPICKTNMGSDHKAGDEAANVKVTLTERCMAIAYDMASFQDKGSEILMSLAQKSLGINYFPTLGVHVHVIKAVMKGGNQNAGVLTLSISGVWFYQFSAKEKEEIKAVTAKKLISRALTEIRKFPGVLNVKIMQEGFGDNYYLPINIDHIHLLILYSGS